MSKYEKPLLLAEKDVEFYRIMHPKATDEAIEKWFTERFNYYLKIL